MNRLPARSHCISLWRGSCNHCLAELSLGVDSPAELLLRLRVSASSAQDFDGVRRLLTAAATAGPISNFRFWGTVSSGVEPAVVVVG
jgi:hypothetical protein